jgi:uncharacterized metal-binding protein
MVRPGLSRTSNAHYPHAGAGRLVTFECKIHLASRIVMEKEERMKELDCASCETHVCRDGIDCFDFGENAIGLYSGASASDMNLTRAAAKVEAQGYMRWPRALEIVRFAEAAGFSHLGIAFCIGLAEEARTYKEFLGNRFRVSSVCCKVCGIPKSQFALEQIRPDDPQEALCAPLCQAEMLNRAGSELNILIGLCVGHDALFAKHSAAPVTTLIAKDRLLGHNPAAALYSRYWKKRLLESGGAA